MAKERNPASDDANSASCTRTKSLFLDRKYKAAQVVKFSLYYFVFKPAPFS